MQNLEEVFNKIQELKKQQKELRRVYKDMLDSSSEYQEAVDDLNKIKENKKQIEGNIKTNFTSEMNKLDRLKQDLIDTEEMLSDIAITKYAKGESIAIKDKDDIVYEPIFKVKFKKA